MPPTPIKSVLLLGSGGLKIGQAGEFDYSGSQAIKALKEEGIKVILINPNIATVQTDPGFADQIYFLPLTFYFVNQVIKKERPEGILLGFGGQTGLNVGLELAEKGVLEKYQVKVLGTPIEAIRATEDRELFVKKLAEIQIKTPFSQAVNNLADAEKAAKRIGYPLMLRAGFSLGGLGSGKIENENELEKKAGQALSASPQILLEEYLGGWKEVEYEVVRDNYDNAVTVCNMENLDPMGIHTGESIVVAPSQTLTNEEYHRLRQIALKVIRHLGIIGECNIQYALNPANGDYRVIEINARLSRSSALASKATGYPLAWVAAKLSLGYSLSEIPNSITRVTQSFFEPSLDYLAVKIPRWDLKKFKTAERQIGSEMKSVGEVMAIGRGFEEVLQKATRMLDIGAAGLTHHPFKFSDLAEEIKNPTDRRLFAIYEAVKRGISPKKIQTWSKIDLWFLRKIKNIWEMEKKLLKEHSRDCLRQAKQLGFSDQQIARLWKQDERQIRRLRKKLKILPAVKQIDTLAGEFPAQTNYLYLTYNGREHDLPSLEHLKTQKQKQKIIILGSGPYRIGSSVEFDWCCVEGLKTNRRLGYSTALINCNPETVSTDYDESDRLYFEELSLERVLDIYEFERPKGVIISLGGQTPNNLALKLREAGVKILGTRPRDIDRAEDRHKFSQLLETLKIDQPAWTEAQNLKEAKKFALKTGYPLLIRPSYVLSGAAMNVVWNEADLKQCLTAASEVSPLHPVVISKFIEEAKEIEIDGAAQKGKLKIYAITEHLEKAGVHSGDATVVIPPQKLYLETIRRVKKITKTVARALKITGPFNIQFLAKDNEIKIIECNLRASRSFPFVSKAVGHNFAALASQAILGYDISGDYKTLDLDYVAVKIPQFSFSRLKGADPVADVEMGSTGEAACFGENYQEAFLKSLLATGLRLPRKNLLLSIDEESKIKTLPAVNRLAERGFKLYATEGTHRFLAARGVLTYPLYKISHESEPNIKTYLSERKIDFIINLPSPKNRQARSDGRQIRRLASDHHLPLITNLESALLFAKAVCELKLKHLKIKSYNEYA